MPSRTDFLDLPSESISIRYRPLLGFLSVICNDLATWQNDRLGHRLIRLDLDVNVFRHHRLIADRNEVRLLLGLCPDIAFDGSGKWSGVALDEFLGFLITSLGVPEVAKARSLAFSLT